MRIGIIGAGLAGLTAARRLADAGHEVAVWDKSRGLGGRLATRRAEVGRIDHGAPWIEADGAFAAELARLQAKGAAAPYQGAWVGLPGMSGLVRPLSEGLAVATGAAVTALDADAMEVKLDSGRHGPFDRLLVAVPAPQARALTGADALDSVVMQPTWTLLAAFETRLDAPDVLRPSHGPAEIALRDAAKPGRCPAETWVLHARQDWSRQDLERSAAEIATDLTAVLADAVGAALPKATYLAAHRWRYARASRPLGRPFLELAGRRVLVGGDWALGSGARHAWASGVAMAAALGA